MMVAVQSISARIGRVTGHGLAANMMRRFPAAGGRRAGRAAVRRQHHQYRRRSFGDGRRREARGRRQPAPLHRLFALGRLLGTVFIPYHRYVDVLKWLTFSLFAYVGIVFTVHLDWREVAQGALLPRFELSGDALTLVVAVFGTTISPYLFFWQSRRKSRRRRPNSEEAPLLEKPKQAPRSFSASPGRPGRHGHVEPRGLLHHADHGRHAACHGQTDIQSAEQAAQALKPIAGEFRLHPVQPRHHRHRPARRAGAGGLRRLCCRRAVRLADRAGTSPGGPRASTA